VDRDIGDGHLRAGYTASKLKIFLKQGATRILILYNITAITAYCTPPPSFEVFLRCFDFFVFFRSRISDWSRCLKKKSVLDREKGYYCTLYCVQYLPPNPPLLPTILRNIFPHDPLYCNKILAISRKGQGLTLTLNLSLLFVEQKDSGLSYLALSG